MKITIINPCRGSADGFTVQSFQEGETVEVLDSLAQQLIRDRNAHAEGCEPMPPFASPFGFRFPEPATDFLSILSDLAHAPAEFDRIFRPQTCRPTNPATLAAVDRTGSGDE